MLGLFSVVNGQQGSLALQLSVAWGCGYILEEDDESDGG